MSVTGGDFNIPDIDWNNYIVSNKSYPYRVSQAFVDIAQEIDLEQMVDSPTRQDNTLDLVITSHPRFKISCKPLPMDQRVTTTLYCLIRHTSNTVRDQSKKDLLMEESGPRWPEIYCCRSKQVIPLNGFDSMEVMWTAVKTAITSALDKDVPTKLTSTRLTHH